MNKYLSSLMLSVAPFFVTFLFVFAQGSIVLTASLDSQTPPAQSISANAENVDVARITLTASGGDVYISGFYVATDVIGGLSNFNNLFIYDTSEDISDDTLLGTYPTQSTNPSWIELSSPFRVAGGESKTFLIRASLSSSAAGNVRVGFSGFTYSTEVAPSLVSVPIYGNVMTLPGATPTPTPTPTPILILTPTPFASPEPSAPAGSPSALGFTSLSALGLSEGDTISAMGSSDPDIYIANAWGYKRLFLNPAIFNFYSHLGGFSNVKTISSSTRTILVTSGLFRNCETNDEKVYGIEITGEDTGILHWVNTSGSQAVADDPEFFKKVFCINSAEFSWYSQGSVYTSVNQVPLYSR